MTNESHESASMKLPGDIGPIHFVGIGGIGMSGIAEVLINLGYTVQGSDASDSANVKRLREAGASVAVGHAAENLGFAEVVVVSTAIKRDNPELVAARTRRLPVVRPADVAIVTNIDPEHLDYFKTFEAIEAAFESFVTNLPFYGFAVMCTDHPAVQTLVGRIEDRRVVTYGENPQADARLVDLTHADG